jgi:ATP-dependent helicase/DNAse subunit B
MLKKASESFKRSGLLLDDVDVLHAMNDEYSSQFLAGITKVRVTGKGKKKKGAEELPPPPPSFKGEALTTLEQFNSIRCELEKTLSDIARNMRAGIADADPLIHKDKSVCEWCEMKAICRVVTKKKSAYDSLTTEE